MQPSKYDAVWVSHSSMGEFLRCPRAYYLHSVYKDPKTGHKMSIVNGALSLGTAVHNTLEALKDFPVNERFTRDLLTDFEHEWEKVSGRNGGFRSTEEEEEARVRGKQMIERVIAAPGPIAQKSVRLKAGNNGMPSNFYLSEDENIILNGLVDWLEWREEDDSIRVIDFKTGKYDENENSLQLPIYLLLLNALQKRRVSGAAYWYLDREDGFVEKTLPEASDAHQRVLAVARQVKAARAKKEFLCPKGEESCYACKPYEAVLRGEAEYIGPGGKGGKQDIYFLA